VLGAQVCDPLILLSITPGALQYFFLTEDKSQSITRSPWKLKIYSQVFVVTFGDRTKEREMRRRMAGEETVELHDVLWASLCPLTENSMDQRKITAQARVFFSAFVEEHATWEIDVTNIPRRVGQAIHGVTPGSQHPSVLGRFTRFRFPFIRLEWTVLTPYYAIRELKAGIRNVVTVETLWKAWSKGGPASGLVAYGTCIDEFIMGTDGDLLIKRRKFTVTNVFHPELMSPVPYPMDYPPMAM